VGLSGYVAQLPGNAAVPVTGGAPPGAVVVDEGNVVVEALGPGGAATVVDVVDVVVVLAAPAPPLSTAMGVVEPGCGCQPGGGWV